MSIFSSPQNRGSAVLASLILVAAAGIAGVVLTAFGSSPDSSAMLAEAAVPAQQKPTKLDIPTGCYAGQVIKIATSPAGKPQVTAINCYNYSFKEYGTGLLWGVLSPQNTLIGPCVSLQNYVYIKDHLNDNTTFQAIMYQNGKCVVTNKQVTMVNSTFSSTKPIYQWSVFSSECSSARSDACVVETCKTEPSPPGSTVVMPQKCDKSAECDAEKAKKDGCADLKKTLNQSPSSLGATPIADQIKQCGTVPNANSSDLCKQVLGQCVTNVNACGGASNVQVAMCNMYPMTKGCESSSQASNPCPSGDQACIQQNTAPQGLADQLNCMAQGGTNCSTSPGPAGQTTCTPACTGTQQCMNGTCQTPSPSDQTTTPPPGQQTAPPSNGHTGGLPQTQSQPPQQQQTQPQPTNCYNNYAATTLVTQQTYPCAQDQNTYNQERQQAQYDYSNQINQYNQCLQQANYARQNNQCPQPCQQPAPMPQIQMCQQQQSPYGRGNDGQPCQQPPQQPDSSQCSNGSFRPVTSPNGCLIDWQCSQNACNSTPQRPDPSGCTSGTWNPLYSDSNNGTYAQNIGGNQNRCVVGWQCVSGSGSGAPQASLQCSPTVADVGATITFTYACTNATASTGSGFSTNNQMNGTANALLAAPPAGTNQATYTLACSNGSASVGASCTVQVALPKIVLVANPATVASGESTAIGWTTSGMKACTISSPQDTTFTSLNANNTSINGMATTSPITQKSDYVLKCTTLGGATKIATTTVSI